MENKTVSVICVSNNRKILMEVLMNSLAKQTVDDFETIVVDTKEKSFTSAASALNYGATLANGDFLVFVHQDVEVSAEFIEQVITLCNQYEFGIAGVAGTTFEEKFAVYSSVKDGKEKKQVGIINKTVREVYSLDECVLIVKKKEFHGFSNLGNTWHFYGVEYSIECNKQGKAVLLFPLPIYHVSNGMSMDATYFHTLLVVGRKHKDLKIIRSCCGFFRNNWLLPMFCQYQIIKMELLKRMKTSS